MKYNFYITNIIYLKYDWSCNLKTNNLTYGIDNAKIFINILQKNLKLKCPIYKKTI